MELEGRSVLITGASSGIGAATARAVARKGARPILLARSADKLEALAAELGGGARAYPVDCSDREAVEAVRRRVEEEVGPPDAIVNNAGAGRFLFFDETSLAEIDEMMRAPFLAAAYVTAAFVPGMVRRGSGAVVTLNTPIAFVAWPGAAGYGMSRWALRGLDATLRVDLHGTGIEVTQVVLGRVASGYFEHNPGVQEAMTGLADWMRTLSTDDAAAAIVRALERGGRLHVSPFRLRLMLRTARMFPAATEFFHRKTTRPRPAPES